MTLTLCRQVENLKEKLISQAQEVSRLRSELVRPTTHPTWGGGRLMACADEGCDPVQPKLGLHPV